MKKIGFIGAYDKTDLILYIAKTLIAVGKKILVIDSTILQKVKYVVPVINPTKSYMTEFEEIDVAVGFNSFDGIKEYLGMPQHAAFTYDYVLIDIDSTEVLQNFEMTSATKNYFVTGTDNYTLKRGLEIIAGIKETMPLTKVVFSRDITQEEDEYLNFLSLGFKVNWKEEKIYFPFEQGDQSAINENQRVSKIKFKKLTELYKESLLYIAEDILEGEKEIENLRKAFKQLEKNT